MRLSYHEHYRVFLATASLTCLSMLAAAGCGPSSKSSGQNRDGAVGDGSQEIDAFWTDPFVDDDGDGYTEMQGDCDDLDDTVYPMAEEICDDGKDNNCNGFVDGSEPDEDQDGWGPCRGDCNDADPEVNPGMNELPANGKDDNCDGIVDADFDGDGFTEADGDCNDNDELIHPDAEENCFDGVDNNCNGFADVNEPDGDGDGFGPCQGDCDDTNGQVNPGVAEIDGDGIDNNCDFLVDEDIDADGWTVANGDCNDNNPQINPAILEVCNDGVDNDCDGTTDTDCLTACEIANLTRSNVGCEYYALDMDNEDTAAVACYAVIVSNTDQTQTANVVIERWVGGVPQALNFPGHGTSRAISPGSLEVFRISGNCSAPGPAVGSDIGVHGTTIQTQGALRITSDLPVVVYQINPYEAANIHTTDASLLIPTPALDRFYYVVSYPQTLPSARGPWDLPAAINIVATQNNTLVTVTSSTNTRAGGGVPALTAGQQYQTTLNQADNLQIETATTPNDLSGTYIEASAPVAVWGGGQCADVPTTQGYCDHLEEMLTPLTTWGTEYVAARHPPRAQEGALWRFVAADNNTTIDFDPPGVHASINLNAGQVYEFETTQDFVAASTSPNRAFFLIQVMVGAEQTAQESGTDIWSLGNLRGDPALALSVPTAQYLDRYVFLSDPTYAYNWLVVVRTDPNDVIHLDCFDPIPNARFTQVGGGPYEVARITLSAESGGADGSCTSGAHTIWGDGPFGIWVWGVYADTSYGYPGGMNLARINPVN